MNLGNLNFAFKGVIVFFTHPIASITQSLIIIKKCQHK
jgi:hypothetical protein